MGAAYHTLHHTLYKDNYGARPALTCRARALRLGPARSPCDPCPNVVTTHIVSNPHPPRRTTHLLFTGQFFVFFDWVHDTLTVPGSRRAGNGIGPELGSEAPVSKAVKRGGATKGVKAH